MTQITTRGAMPPEEIRAGLESHDRALHIKDGWMRDPYIILHDGYFYLTGTTPNRDDPREKTDYYNAGLTNAINQEKARISIVGQHIRLWRSADLVEWEYLGEPFNLEMGYWTEKEPEAFEEEDTTHWHLWAPELHRVDGKWVYVHTSPGPVRGGANFAIANRDTLTGPFSHPMSTTMQRKHDPSIFTDDDGTHYLLWGNTFVAPIKPDLSGFSAEPIRIDPSGTRPDPRRPGQMTSRIGHEGATIRKIGGKYVHFGTAWSTDGMRQGTYNMYYCVAEKITGPYGPRKFAGRFLGHGTPFQDKQGRWWCTAFYNSNVEPISREDALQPWVGDNAYTINEQGVTIVPLDVRVLENGEIYIRAKDPAYANPGPEEAQKF